MMRQAAPIRLGRCSRCTNEAVMAVSYCSAPPPAVAQPPAPGLPPGVTNSPHPENGIRGGGPPWPHQTLGHAIPVTRPTDWTPSFDGLLPFPLISNRCRQSGMPDIVALPGDRLLFHSARTEKYRSPPVPSDSFPEVPPAVTALT